MKRKLFIAIVFAVSTFIFSNVTMAKDCGRHEVHNVPEPSTLILVGSGLLTVGIASRSRKIVPK